MGAGLPPESEVLAAARAVLERHGTVVSQSRFVDLVRLRIRAGQDAVRLGPHRLRRLMAQAGFCAMEVRTRRSASQRPLSRCPVCRGPLDEVRNRTLFGGEVALTRRCRRCPYWTGEARRVPVLYVFHYAA